jgi:hypothetical protein
VLKNPPPEGRDETALWDGDGLLNKSVKKFPIAGNRLDVVPLGLPSPPIGVPSGLKISVPSCVASIIVPTGLPPPTGDVGNRLTPDATGEVVKTGRLTEATPDETGKRDCDPTELGGVYALTCGPRGR